MSGGTEVGNDGLLVEDEGNGNEVVNESDDKR